MQGSSSVNQIGPPAVPWLKATFEWRRLVVLFLLAGFTTRVVTGVAFELMSVRAGWSGIATVAVVYTAIVAVPVHTRGRAASLAAVAFGREGTGAGDRLPHAVRRAVWVVLVVGAIPIAVAVATMPGSGRVIDDGTWMLMGGAVFAVQLWLVFVQGLGRGPRRRLARGRG
jgi:hypothetical protein